MGLHRLGPNRLNLNFDPFQAESSGFGPESLNISYQYLLSRVKFATKIVKRICAKLKNLKDK